MFLDPKFSHIRLQAKVDAQKDKKSKSSLKSKDNNEDVEAIKTELNSKNEQIEALERKVKHLSEDNERLEAQLKETQNNLTAANAAVKSAGVEQTGL